MRITLLLHIFLLTYFQVAGQSGIVSGKVSNDAGEPLYFVSVSIKNITGGMLTKEDGKYSVELESGRYELVFSMVGYKPRVIAVVVKPGQQVLDIILETDHGQEMSEVIIQRKKKDRSVEYIRNVIRNKDSILMAAENYSVSLYIKAIQEDSSVPRKNKKNIDTVNNPDSQLDKMNMAEVVLRLDKGNPRQIKEERTAITKRGNTGSLFYLSATDGDFNFYHNLLHTPSVSAVPILSPVSYSGLMAYRYKLVDTKDSAGRKIYTISIKPRQVSNATVEGTITIMDSAWVILYTQFSFPEYHLPVYDFFEVSQSYQFVNNYAWLITRQEFRYFSGKKRGHRSGETIVHYRDFEFNKIFPRAYFGTELSATGAEAYKRDSSFWNGIRPEPLTAKEIRYIHYKDSIHSVRTSKEYLDSIDRKVNKFTWKTLLWTGQTIQNHEKESRWNFPPLPSLFQPLQFGGSRISVSASHYKIYKSRKNFNFYTNISYGLRNKDINGSLRIFKMYNPFNRGFYTLNGGREFQYIYSGDAWINLLKRSNIYLNNSIGVGHGLELINGLYLYTDLDIALRRSVSDYGTNDKVDSVLGDVLTNNEAVAFTPYNATYGKLRLAYTPRQRYIREPAEKIILGSYWPTFYALWRKGIPGLFNSAVNFDYLEFGIEHEVKAGLTGILKYSVKSGSFLTKKDLRLVDYKFQRRGDPLLFMNPNESFQAMDSTFALFKRFYQAHFVHDFNGAIINKIPLLKKLRLREVAGTGFLIAPERDLRYVEAFAGIERVFKWPFNVDNKFKLGVYVVGSAANQFNNPVQFKIGITAWDRIRDKWH